MSGICGIYESGRELGNTSVEPMLDALALSAETPRQALSARSVALGTARRWGFQCGAEFDGISIVADADLIELNDLAADLGLSTAEARSLPVAALIGRLYRIHGADFLKRIRGGFAIALWDSTTQRLLLAIDRIGIKSLYWRKEGDRLLFATRIGAIRATQLATRDVNRAAVLQFLLFSAVPAPATIDAGTQKLRPGTLLLVKAGQISEHQYWDLEYPESDNHSVAHWSRELREGMRAAVSRHFGSSAGGATGCYLSGGTDSSSVVAFASEVHNPVPSFSIAFEETGFSEIEFARKTAATFTTNHHEKFVSPGDAPAALDKIIDYYEEPFANSSAIGSYYCAVLARENGVHTLLAGDGGDELFGGNERYAFDKRFALYQSIPRFLRRYLIAPVVNCLPDADGKLSLPKKYVRRASIPNPRRMLSYGFFLDTPPSDIFEDGFLHEVGPTQDWLRIPEDHFKRVRASSELNRILYMDVKMTLADNDLRKVSGTAELAGVNVRYPLLDDRLAELSGRIPANLKLKGFEKRYIFKQAMSGILPEKVLYKKKHGFGVPLAQWLLRDKRMRDLVDDLMHDPHTRQRGYFRAGFVERLASLHRLQPNFYGEIMWYLVALELWYRKHAEGTRAKVSVG